MTQATIYASPNPSRAMAQAAGGGLAVCLFGDVFGDCGAAGTRVRRELDRVRLQPNDAAWDVLAFALSVTAADVLVPRSRAADGWTRQLHVVTELADPTAWQATAREWASLLGFLSGDIWELEFRPEGLSVPTIRGALPPTEPVACLFSGGLDSYVGAIDLVAQDVRPMLVSQAYRVEHRAQSALAGKVGKLPPHLRQLQVDASPTHPSVGGNERETSMRTRSLLFMALGAVAASAGGSASGVRPTVVVPENGFIALNPPLTPRRVGSLSTRTTHPTFLTGLESVLAQVGVDCKIHNPYDAKTKGEMLVDCPRRAILERCAQQTISCGKSGRKNQQCGRCVPCLIRRAAFLRADLEDGTEYQCEDLRSHAATDDVLSVRAAIERSRRHSARRWLRASAPLPDPSRTAEYVAVVERGLAELDDLMTTVFEP